MRHGESLGNIKKVLSSHVSIASLYPLTEVGVDQVCRAVDGLMGLGITQIIYSPLLRAQQTAEIISDALGIAIREHVDLREIDMGEFDGKSERLYHEFFQIHRNSFDVPVPGGESWRDVASRMSRCVFCLDQEFSGTAILLVSHENPIALLDWSLRFTNPADFEKARFLQTGEWMKLETQSA